MANQAVAESSDEGARTTAVRRLASRAVVALMALATVAAVTVAGCSGTRGAAGGRAGATPPSASGTAAAPREQTYYAASEGLPVYAEPSSSAKVVGRLAQYERVTRSRLERGYALIRADRSGAQGWVDNAQLLWRVPSATAEPKNAEELPAAGGAAEHGEAPPPESTASPSPTSTPALVAATPATPPAAQPSPPRARPTSAGPAPSMFNPY
jgi:hypothetical protein